MLEAIVEIILTPIVETIFEPVEKWVTAVTNQKTKPYNRLLRGLIKAVVYSLCIGLCLGLLAVVIVSYLQRARVIEPVFNAALARFVLLVNTLFLASAIPLSIFHAKIKRQKYLVIPVSIVVFIFNILFLLVTQ